ncbi:MAG: peptidylprolyl isomerase [Planctomycetota bacterium]|jgi:hypothetical protein
MKAVLLMTFAFILVGCPVNSSNSPAVNEVDKTVWDFSEFMQLPEDTASSITVQHCLIGVQSGLPAASRDEAAARSFALELYKRAQDGEDFDALVKEYTDDSHPGIYTMHSDGSRPGPGEHKRTGMVPAFGNVGWRLKVGEIGMSDFDSVSSPYGFHIVKRIK